MKVAISTDNNEVSAHFGRCQQYTIFEVEGGFMKKIGIIICGRFQNCGGGKCFKAPMVQQEKVT
jgi:predicted Fe-Mo cluster-binding NifX family protein